MNEKEFNIKNMGFKMLKELIQAKVPPDEVMAVLAEESAELSHAALKMRRAFKTLNEGEDNPNPTPISFEDAMTELYEEVADVLLALKMCEMLESDDIDIIGNIMLTKGLRWVQRLGYKADGE